MTVASDVVLSVRDLRKKIKNKWIIKGISFEVYGGEVFGFMGPNGSGKTTTIRMLVDLIRPTEGSVRICGFDVQTNHDEALQYVGCIVENPELYSYLSGWENLEHFARMLPGVGEQKIREVAELVGMDHRIHDKVRTYSLGMRQRLGIAQALLGSPKLLILDEPTNGLDPQGIKEMREFILRLASTGLSVFVSSHLLSEIEHLCDRVAIISHGEVIRVGEVDEIIAQAGSKVVWKVEPLEPALAVLGRYPDVHVLSAGYDEQAGEAGARFATVTAQMSGDVIPPCSRQLVEAGVALYGVELKHPTLEDMFLNLTEGERIG